MNDVQSKLEKLEREERELKLKEFQKIKNKVCKKFPDAHTEKDKCGKFFVANSNGGHVISHDYYVPNSNTVYDAWSITYDIIKIDIMMEKNKKSFSDENIFKKLIHQESM